MDNEQGETGSTQSTVRSVERAVQILEFLRQRNSAVSVNEMANDLKIPRSTAFRIVKTLEESQYVHNVTSRGDYILGARVMSLAYGDNYLRKARQIANKYMYELANKSRQTVQLGVLFEYDVMYLEQINANARLSVVVPSETPFPVNLSAGGKILAAYLPEKQRTELVDRSSFAANTVKTIVSKGAFLAELDRVREKGYAMDDEEFAEGIRCIAAPIFGPDGNCEFSLGITGHVSEIGGSDSIQFFTNAVVETSAHISRALGFEG